MNSFAVFFTLLVCILPIIECSPKNRCEGCSLSNGSCILFGTQWTEGSGPGCFDKKCHRIGEYGWKISVTAARCRTDNGSCVDPGQEWVSKKDGRCYRNQCLANGELGIKVKIFPTDC